MPRIAGLFVIGAALFASSCASGGTDAAAATADRNKALVRQWIEEIDRSPNAVEILDKWMTPDFKAEFNGLPVDLKAYRDLMAGFVKAFSNFQHEITYLVAEGDQVALGMKLTMTHSGDYEGLAGTGRRVTIIESGVVRLRDGKIAEERSVADLAALDQQLRAPADAKK